MNRIWVAGLLAVGCAAPPHKEVLLATTTSTRDTGLLDSLLPLFQQRSGYKVNVVAVGTGQAIAMARRGDAEVVLVHAPEMEQAEVDSGHFVRRRIVMHNDFLFVGPSTDPARLRGMHDPVAAVVFGQPVIAEYTVVGGKFVVKEGKLATVDEHKLIERHNKAAKKLLEG